MKSFHEYHESKQLAQQERERAIIEENRKKEIALEQKEAGWNEFTGNQDMVETYLKWATGNSKRSW